MRRRQSLVLSVEHADGTAVILREGSEFWLSGYADTSGGRLDGHRPDIYGLEDDRTAVGGLLPPGAVDAEIVDRAGSRHRAVVSQGAWLAVIDDPAGYPLPPVRYADADGRTVPQPLPEQWPRRPLPSTDESCLACGAVSWDEVIPSRGERGRYTDLISGRWEPMPIVVCRECGHDRAGGTNCGEIGDFPWARRRGPTHQVLASLREAVRRSGFRRDIG